MITDNHYEVHFTDGTSGNRKQAAESIVHIVGGNGRVRNSDGVVEFSFRGDPEESPFSPQAQVAVAQRYKVGFETHPVPARQMSLFNEVTMEKLVIA